MAKTIFEDREFKVVKGYDFIVVRKDSPYSFHSHFKSLTGARGLIRLFYKKVQPFKEYFNTAMKRVTTDREFDSFRKEKKGSF